MKRFVSILLSLALCVFCLSAFAEAPASDFDGDEINLSIPEVELPKVELKAPSQAVSTCDTVVKQNNVYTICTPTNLNISLNAKSLSSFLILTQSYYASIDVYSCFKDDATANEYINNLISKDIHVVVWDTYDAFQAIMLHTLGSDKLSQHVVNLSGLSESDINAVAGRLASANDVSNYTLYSFNGNVWIQLASNVLVTIVNSEYVCARYYPNGDSMTQDDYDDFTRFLRAITLS